MLLLLEGNCFMFSMDKNNFKNIVHSIHIKIHCCYLRAKCWTFTNVDVLTLCFSKKMPAAGNLAFTFRGQWYWMKWTRFYPSDLEGRSNNSVCNTYAKEVPRVTNKQICSYIFQLKSFLSHISDHWATHLFYSGA